MASGPPGVLVLSEEHGRIGHAREPTVTDKQQGWNDALNIVFDQFNYVAWQKGRGQERQRAAEGMEKLAKHKCRGKSEDYQQTMHDVVTPFCEMLKGDKSQPEPPFNIELPEAERQGRNDALEIVLDTFRGFAQQKGLQLEWTCSEIAEDMGKRVEYAVKERSGASWQAMGDEVKSQAYRQAMNDVVIPFREMLKGRTPTAASVQHLTPAAC